MRTILAALVLVIVAGGAVKARDPSEDAQQAAAAASRMAAIKAACPEAIPTDKLVADKYVGLYGEAGIKIVGIQRWSKIIKDQTAQRIREIDNTGPQRWCEDQRRYLRELGETKVFP